MSRCRFIHVTAFALMLLPATGCGGGGDGSTSGGASGQGGQGGDGVRIDVSAIRIEPLDAVLDVPHGTPVSLAYRVFGTPVSGGPEVVLDATLSFSRPGLGTFTGPQFSGSGERGGTGTVTATYGEVESTTSLTLDVHADIALDGLAPALIPAVLAATDDPALSPAWSYPEDGTVIPPNVYDVAFRFAPQGGSDAFLVRFAGEGGAVQVLTTQPELTLTPTNWNLVVDLLGPGALEVTTYGFASADPSRAGTSTRTFHRSESALRGAMYYWSSKGDHAPVQPNEDATAPRGYFRFDFTNAEPGGKAELFLGFNRAGNVCVGCHSITRDGKRFATSYEGDTRWGIFDVASTADPMQYDTGGPSDPDALGHFNTFTPDGQWLLVSGGSMLRAFDLSAPATTLAASFPTQEAATHIAVSPRDGATVLYVEDRSGPGGTRAQSGRLVRIRWDAAQRAFVDREVFLEEAGASLYYPAISPDGAWVLYNRTTSGSSLSNPLAEVWARRLDGGEPVQLSRANQGPALSNSWARWAPFTADDGHGNPRYFFTFSSVRPYGSAAGNPQLWLSSFDPSGNADDPSTPALWLPMQSLSLNNHAAQWTEIFVNVPQ
ncbi:hypothetical protein [Chondromyces crocatus]|uniref:Cytochrome c domain-containing protein n=1 Tax=Chondromyces crocatus TaxID=52 RepID=A0A0K1E659_CHOCO|nr:hypothetical protein [Chondromyces crocatus]AKT36053.1 uncharacterized protein CMC5_001650 [Chondromyces crocatus]